MDAAKAGCSEDDSHLTLEVESPEANSNSNLENNLEQSHTNVTSKPPEAASEQQEDLKDDGSSDDDQIHSGNGNHDSDYDTDDVSEDAMLDEVDTRLYGSMGRCSSRERANMRKAALRRVHQTSSYTYGLESRVRYLEEKIDQLLNLDPAPEVSEPEQEEPKILRVAEVRKQAWGKWAAPSTQRERPWAVVEAVMEKPQNVMSAAISEFFRRRLRNSVSLSEAPERREVERVRLNSPHIHEFFRGIMGESAPKDESVFLKPFKPLMVYFDDLCGYVDTLERDFALQNTSRVSMMNEGKVERDEGASEIAESSYISPGAPNYNGPQSTSSVGPELRQRADVDQSQGPNKEGKPSGPENEPPVSQEMLDHLGCLLGFIKDDLGDDLRRYSDLRAGRITEVAFKDLWSLFAPGSVVYDQTTKQASRIYHTHGGRPMLTRTLPRKSESEPSTSVPKLETTDGSDEGEDDSLTPFIVNSLYLDFDGEEVGPIHHQTRIAPYEGELPISNLPIAPLTSYSSTGNGSKYGGGTPLEDYLQNRGERFWAFVNPEMVAHHEYTGFSLGVDREQVSPPLLFCTPSTVSMLNFYTG